MITPLIRPVVARERDESTCGACGATIPNLPDGTLYNHFHAPHCSFYAPRAS